ncbi:MAG: DUF177 domain-containing protein [Candidatus Pelagadaptatus aseana]
MPRQLDPRKFAQKQIEIEGPVAFSDMPRVAELVLNPSAEVHVALAFGMDEQRTRLIKGEITGLAEVTCQRCLESMELPFEAELNLAIVWDEDEAKNLPKRFDPLIVGEGVTDIYTVIEDEILLELPMVSYHDHNCQSKTSFGDEGEAGEEASSNERNPFQILEQLKGSPKS